MATIKIFNNKRGNLVAKVQIYAKDIKTGQHKLTSKTLHNDQKLTEAKFRKQVERFALDFETEARDAYENSVEQLKNKVLPFSKLADEYIANAKKNLSQNYYEKLAETVKKFNAYLTSVHLDKVPISEIKTRDVQMFLNSFTTYNRNSSRVKLKQPLPDNINYRLIDREGILNKGSAYKLRCRNGSIPKENALRLCEFCQLSFNEYFDEVTTTKSYSVETIKGYRRRLIIIFNEAVRYEWMTKNPVCSTKIGAGNNNTTLKTVSKKEVYTYNEVQQFLAALDMLDESKINKKITLKTMLLTGIRKGEMSGLKWCDIDFENQIIKIQRNRLYSHQVGTYEKSPKTKTSERNIPIPDSLMKDLLEYYEWFKDADKNFENELDKYYIASTITREPAPTGAPYYWLSDFLQKNNLRHLGCHGLRHTYCSLLLSKNIPIQTVSKYMGHSDSTITLKVYSHFIPDTQERVLNVLNNLII